MTIPPVPINRPSTVEPIQTQTARVAHLSRDTVKCWMDPPPPCDDRSSRGTPYCMGRGTYLGLDGLVMVEVVCRHAAPVEASTALIAAEPMAFPVHVLMQLQALLVGTIPSTLWAHHTYFFLFPGSPVPNSGVVFLRGRGVSGHTVCIISFGNVLISVLFKTTLLLNAKTEEGDNTRSQFNTINRVNSRLQLKPQPYICVLTGTSQKG